MINELKSDEIIKKVGGRFKLTALVQRRLGELMQGARPLIENTEGRTAMEIVIQEILQDKIAADDGPSSKSSKMIDSIYQGEDQVLHLERVFVHLFLKLPA